MHFTIHTNRSTRWSKTKKRCKATHERQVRGMRTRRGSHRVTQVCLGRSLREAGLQASLETGSAWRGSKEEQASGKGPYLKKTAEQKLHGGRARSMLDSRRRGDVGCCAVSSRSLSPCFPDLLAQRLHLSTQIYLHCYRRAACCGPCFSIDVLVEGLQKSRS